MDHEALAKLQQMLNELDAAVQDSLACYGDEALLQLLDVHLNEPEMLISIAAITSPRNLALMSAVTLQRERLRRAELKLMEAVV